MEKIWDFVSFYGRAYALRQIKVSDQQSKMLCLIGPLNMALNTHMIRKRASKPTKSLSFRSTAERSPGKGRTDIRRM